MCEKSNRENVRDMSISYVLYCLICRKLSSHDPVQFLLIEKQGHPTFPSTKLRQGESLYKALVRPLKEDLGLKPGSYFLEDELPLLLNDHNSPRYEGLNKKWYLYPVTISLTESGWANLNTQKDIISWKLLNEVLADTKEPNVRTIANYVQSHFSEVIDTTSTIPSMDALACHWASLQETGVRVVKSQTVDEILSAGNRAFNLRVADPYLPYQKQGLGFTWSFFSPKDKQDVHVHGLPAVEIYGILSGEMQIWSKPMNQRGSLTWNVKTLQAGDWAEVEPLHCHFAYWLTPQGKGTVIKASGSGELAGVGKLGITGKTTCQYCHVKEQCAIHPIMKELLLEFQKPFEDRDYQMIPKLTKSIQL